jgi:hypothetical protein
MSQEQENAKLTGGEGGDAALSALRGIWKAQGQTSADLDEACGPQGCKSMEAVGFQALGDEETDDQSNQAKQAVGNNLRSAWKTKLEREGKLNTEAGSVRDLVFGASDPKE